uniref:Protein EFR3 n=1 Tax=Piliocolobus tephrosceles TaxID=591936 RepID=A0A8C9I631_9PRIM
MPQAEGTVRAKIQRREPRVCCCCSALRPRYKRLVDNIFPEDPKDGLVKADMEKLTFYAVSAPEKLDRIGSYLAERLSRDVVRHRSGYVLIAMEALDQLLMACHSQSIKPFVESFLHMVAKLLESGEPKLQVLGTNSFVKFANIEEDTPSYHRRYDFFVSRFSAMCHSCHSDPEIRTEYVFFYFMIYSQ